MSCLYRFADRYKTHQVKKDAVQGYLKSPGRNWPCRFKSGRGYH